MSDEQNNKDPKKSKSTLDKIVMGAIIGGAIGSALGMSLAPKSGKETREYLKDKTETITKDVKDAGKLTRETTFGLMKLARNLVFGRTKTKTPQKATNDLSPSKQVQGLPENVTRSNFKQIPNEMDIEAPDSNDVSS